MKNILYSLNEKLSTVANNQVISERYRIFTEIYKKLNTVIGPYALTNEQFKNLFIDLKTEICDMLPTNKFINGDSTNMSTIVKGFESENLLNFDFNVASIKDHIKFTDPIMNPLVYSWIVSIFIIMVHNRYDVSNTYQISTKELDEIKKVKTIGDSIRNFFTSLNAFEANPNDYITSLNTCKTEYQKFMDEEMTTVKADIKVKYDQESERLYNVQRETFKTQTVPFTLDHPNAYTGCEQLEKNYDRKGRYRPVTYHGDNSARFRERYRVKLVPQIDQYKASYTGKFMTSTTNSLILPCNLTFTIHYDAIKRLLQYGIGRISAEYSVEGGQFIVTNYYVLNNQKYALTKKSYPYDNSDLWFYWIGGNYSKGKLFRDCIYEGIYENYCQAPLAEQHNGAMHTVVPEVPISLTMPNIIAAEIVKVDKKYRDTFHEKLIASIKNEESSEFSKTVLELSYKYYMLKDIYTVTNHVNRLNIISTLRYGNGIPTVVPTFERKHYNNEIFNHVMAILDAKIEIYESKCVEIDDLNNSIHSSKLLNALGKAVLSVSTPKQQQEILRLMQSTLQIEGNGLQMLLENNV